jgi:hypothetical protein
MKNLNILFLMLLALPGFGAELEGVKLEDRVPAVKQELVLNGIAVRTRLFFKVYVAGLYLPQKTQDAKAALAMPGEKRMVLAMLRDVGRTAFAEALTESFAEANGDLGLSTFKSRVDALQETLYGIGDAKTGMKIVFDFIPGTGTAVSVDGRSLGKPIPGDDFSVALLRIWIGQGAVADNVRKALLGTP